MEWMLEDTRTKARLDQTFSERHLAEAFRKKLGPVLANRYQSVVVGDNPHVVRMLSEGLVRGDLRDILLPRLSIDEYVSADPESDNVVIAFFLKGVPEAVLPLKNFCEHCEGVSLADYASSETIENCTIVYAEMDRPTVKIENIVDMLEQVCVVADMEMADFTLTFPNTQRKYPYDVSVIEKYFRYRTEEKSREAAELAKQEAEQNEQVQESIVEEMVKRFGVLSELHPKSTF